MKNKTITIPYNEYKDIEKKLSDQLTQIKNLEGVITGDSVLRVETNPMRYFFSGVRNYESHKCTYYGNEDFLSQLSEIKELNDQIHATNKSEYTIINQENIRINNKNNDLRLENESLKIKNIKLNDKLKNRSLFQLIFGD
jgi:hypothetical protein